MKRKKADTPGHHKCPHCKTQFKTPACCFAHWMDVYKVQCEKCFKFYEFFQGRTEKIHG
jgi:hypothetical protein